MPADTPQLTDTIIIGAGPSGLAVGACLSKRNRSFTILEAGDAVGWRWRHHYERLHLHTVKQHSWLPYLRYPAHYPTYPSRAQIVEYLESYQAHFGLAPRFGETVRGATHREGRWELETGAGRYASRHLVVATGYNRDPIVPHLARPGGVRRRDRAQPRLSLGGGLPRPARPGGRRGQHRRRDRARSLGAGGAPADLHPLADLRHAARHRRHPPPSRQGCSSPVCPWRSPTRSAGRWSR